MSRPRSVSGGPAATASNRRRRALTYGDLPKEIKGVIQDYLAYSNEELRAAVEEYFEDKAACERRHGKINTWDVGRVTDMSKLFCGRRRFNEARSGVEEDVPSPRRASRSVNSTSRVSSTRVEVRLHRTWARGTRRR